MNLDDAETIAVSLLGRTWPRTIGPDVNLAARGWTFDFDTARKRFGLCSFSKRKITVSRYLTEINDEQPFRDIVLHEIAHALVGVGKGHGGVWKEQARLIGAPPTRCYDSDVVDIPPRRWIGHCPDPDCDQVYIRDRLAKYLREGKGSCHRHDDGVKRYVRFERNPAYERASA